MDTQYKNVHCDIKDIKCVESKSVKFLYVIKVNNLK